MSLHDILREGLDETLSCDDDESPREPLYDPTGKELGAILSTPKVESEFEDGQEIVSNALQARVSRTELCTDPALETIWKARSRRWRLVSMLPAPSSIVLVFEDENN